MNVSVNHESSDSTESEQGEVEEFKWSQRVVKQLLLLYKEKYEKKLNEKTSKKAQH